MQLPQPHNYAKLFLDMNSFFASVEQQVQPPFRAQPIAIAPYVGPTGCIISPSGEAKLLGVKTGMSVGEGKKICPKLQILPSRPFLYHLYHKEIVKVLDEVTPFLRILSIDEMAINLDPVEQNSLQATKIGQDIKKKIKEKVGDWLTCSVGVGPNQFLAKVAAESQKPDGLTLITLEEIPAFYQRFKLLDLPGINFRLKQSLNFIGINTTIDLFQTQIETLGHFFNYPGKLWYWRLRGYEVDDFTSQTFSVGHSFVLPPEYRSQSGAKKVIIKLVTKVAYRLRKEGVTASSLSVSLKFVQGGGVRKFTNFTPAADTQSLLAQALRMFKEIPFSSSPILIHVVAFKLNRGGKQYSLFPNIQKMADFSESLDKINDKFGTDTIYFAETEGDRNIAPNRIAFGKPKYQFEEK